MLLAPGIFQTLCEASDSWLLTGIHVLLESFFQTGYLQGELPLRCSAGSLCLHSPSPLMDESCRPSHNTALSSLPALLSPQTLLPLYHCIHNLFPGYRIVWLQCCLCFLKIQPNPSFTDCGLSHTMDCVRCFQPTCTLISVERVKQEQDRFPFKAYQTDFF